MRISGARTALTLLLASCVVGVVAGTARADITPPPDPVASPSVTDTTAPLDPAASPSATSDPPAPAPSTVTLPTPSPSDAVPPPPLPTGSDGSPVVWPSTDPAAAAPTDARRPGPAPLTTTAAQPSTSSDASSEPSSAGPDAVAPSPPNDGVAPVDGQVDDYLALTAQRDPAAARQRALADAAWSAHVTVLGLEAEYGVLSVQADTDEHLVVSAQVDADAVAAQMYQQGDGGLGAIASVIGGGPDGFLARLDAYRMVHDTANVVVHDVESARLDLALTRATLESVGLRLAAARATEKDALAAAEASAAALATIDAKLMTFDVVAPQVAVGPDGCPTQDVPATLRDGSDAIGVAALCRAAIRQAATPQAALAITWAFQHLGAAYACGGAGRLLPFRADCSSFVSRAYHEGAGLATAGDGWAPSTRDMVPWDGVALDPHYAYVAPPALRAGDLVLYDTCPQGGCAYKHVVMYLGSPDGGRTFWMIHTNSCGDVAKVEAFWGFPTTGHPFLVARRVLALPGETVAVPTPVQARARAADARALVAGSGIG